MGQSIQLTAADGFVFPAYEALPVGTPKGAVVVLQEIFGVNSHIRAVADGFAADGYLALAPATFHRVKDGVELGYGPDDIAAGRELKAAVEGLPAPGVLPDIAAAVAHAARVGKVAVMGYCWGGLLAWRSACLLPEVSAVVTYYGGGMTETFEAARKPLCPVLAHFGEQDHAIPIEGVHAFAQVQPAVEVAVYPAQHGFNCDHRGAFDPTAAAQARARTLAFLARHVG